MVSQASGHIGFVLRPAQEGAVFDRVEFIPLSATRVLVVIVARGGHVIQKVIDIGEPLDADDLRQAANYLNAEFSGLPLANAREAVLERINEERLLYDALLARAMRLATSTFADLPAARDDLRGRRGVAARRNARADARHAADAARDDGRETAARPAAERIHRRPRPDGGDRRRTPDPNLRSFSLIVSTYGDGMAIGTVGVIGPTRMRYPRHRRRGRRRAGGLARSARSQLGTYG